MSSNSDGSIGQVLVTLGVAIFIIYSIINSIVNFIQDHQIEIAIGGATVLYLLITYFLIKEVQYRVRKRHEVEYIENSGMEAHATGHTRLKHKELRWGPGADADRINKRECEAEAQDFKDRHRRDVQIFIETINKEWDATKRAYDLCRYDAQVDKEIEQAKSKQ